MFLEVVFPLSAVNWPESPTAMTCAQTEMPSLDIHTRACLNAGGTPPPVGGVGKGSASTWDPARSPFYTT